MEDTVYCADALERRRNAEHQSRDRQSSVAGGGAKSMEDYSRLVGRL